MPYFDANNVRFAVLITQKYQEHFSLSVVSSQFSTNLHLTEQKQNTEPAVVSCIGCTHSTTQKQKFTGKNNNVTLQDAGTKWHAIQSETD